MVYFALFREVLGIFELNIGICMTKRGYNVTIGLDHDEVAAKVNSDSGEVTIIKRGRVPDGMELVTIGKFSRQHTDAWIYLEKKLSTLEFAVANRMALMAGAYTNSLKPLSDESTICELTYKLGIGKNKVISVTKKLFDMGVFAKFDVKEVDVEYKKYWIFNPYLSFNGRFMDMSMKNLFKNTLPAKVMRGEIS